MTDQDFLRYCYKIALEQSTDPSTQNAGILVDEYGSILCHGANHLPKGVISTEERWQRPLKYIFVEHAERNTIFSAAREGIKTKGTTMYCCWAACHECAKAIIQSDIKLLITHHDPLSDTRFGKKVSSSWLDSIKFSMQMFKESGVEVKWIEEQLFKENELQIRFNEELVIP